MQEKSEIVAFLRTILPSHGPFYLYSKAIQPRAPLQTIEDAVNWALYISTDVNVSLVSFEDKRGGKFRAARSFWADVDIGNGKNYGSQVEAIEAINEAIHRGLLPMRIISSGVGLHLIWTLTEEIGEYEWRKCAAGLRNAIAESGLSFDAQRTTDPSNGPRVIGTTNSKNAQPVSFVRRRAPAYSLEYFREYVSQWGEPDGGHGEPEELDYWISDNLGFDFVYGREFDAESIATECAQMRALRDGIPVYEPVWQSLLCVLMHTRDGESIAHRWSSLDERYNESDTQSRCERIVAEGYKPTTCETLRRINPAGCQGCTHKINSPISLGVIKPPVLTQSVEIGKAEYVLETPYGYDVINGFINYLDDKGQHKPICQALHCVGMSMHGQLQWFTWAFENKSEKRMDSFTLAGDKCNTAGVGNKIIVSDSLRTDKYMGICRMAVLNKKVEKTCKSFGWNKDRTEFYLGSTVFSASGERSVSSFAPSTQDLAKLLIEDGDLVIWQRAAMRVMKEGMEAGSFLTLLSAGTPFHALMTDEGGCVVVLRSHGSGHGKTTCLASAGSIWGDWKNLGNWSNNTKITNANHWEAMSNIPIPYDDFRMNKDEDLSSLVMTFSEGEARGRAGKDGANLEKGDSWSTFLLCTANPDIRGILANMDGATEGPTARVMQLEINIDKRTVQDDGGETLNFFSRNYGFAGRQIVGSIFRDPKGIASITETLIRSNSERMQRLDLPGSARFACRAITCAELGGKLLVHLGILPGIDVERIIKHVEGILVATINRDKESAASQDIVAKYIRTFIGSLVVLASGSTQGPLRDIRGRYDARTSTLYVPVLEWDKWLSKHNKSFREATLEFKEIGHIVSSAYIDLAKDTSIPKSSKVRCVEIQLAKDSTESETINNVISINRSK